MTEPRCEACGTPWTEHLGMMGTCRKLQDALARLSVKCEHPEAAKCAKLWAADHDRAQLEAVDPALAEEFPFGCDTVEHLAVALLAAREQRDELAANLDALTGRAT